MQSPEERASTRPKSSELVDSRIKWRTQAETEAARGPPAGDHGDKAQRATTTDQKKAGPLNPGAHLSDVDPDADSSTSEEPPSSTSRWRSCWPGPGSTRPLATFPDARSGARLCPRERPVPTGDPGEATLGADDAPAYLLAEQTKANSDENPPIGREPRREIR